MSYLDLTLVFFLLLVVLNYWVHRSVLYPPFVFCAMWVLDLAVIRLGLIDIDPLHGNTLAIVALGSASFSAGGLLAGLMPQTLLRIHLFPSGTKMSREFVRKALVIVLLCGLPVYFYQTLQLSRSVGGGLNMLVQARMARTEAAMGTGIQSFLLNFFTLIAISSSLLLATEKKDRKFWIVTAIAFIACILSTGRTDLLLLISGLSAIRLLQSKQDTLLRATKFLRWPVALFVTLYILLIFTNKNTEGLAGDASGIVTFYVLSYIAGPLAAFDSVVQHPEDFLRPSSHTFEFFLRLGAKLNLLDYTRLPTLDTYVFVPFPTNVYTVFKFYFLELGIVGTAVFLFFFGLLHSLLYLKARNGGRLSNFLFAYSMFPVLMVIFDDWYFNVGEYLRAVLFGFLYLLLASWPLGLFLANEPESPPVESELQKLSSFGAQP